MTALSALSFQRLGTTRNPRPSLTNAERLRAYRMAVEPELANNWPWKFTARSSLTLSPEGGDSGFHPDPPTPEEVAEAGRFKYG
jgi:hypothetical protein